MPQVLIKFGLIENGAGKLCCPRRDCRSDRLKLVLVAYTTGHATTVTHPGMTKVTWKDDHEASGTTMDAVYQCHQGHQFGVEMTYVQDPEDVTMGGVRYQTTWEDGDGDE